MPKRKRQPPENRPKFTIQSALPKRLLADLEEAFTKVPNRFKKQCHGWNNLKLRRCKRKVTLANRKLCFTHGEAYPKKVRTSTRKVRSDKGKKRGPRKKK